MGATKGSERRLALVILLSCSALAIMPSARAHMGELGPFMEMPSTIIPYEQNATVTVDGVVGGEEYPSGGTWIDTATGFTMNSVHDNDSLYIALTNPFKGWMAIGFSSDLDSGMGFVMIGNVSGTVTVTTTWADDVMDMSGALQLNTTPHPSAGLIEDSRISIGGVGVVAELKLMMMGDFWMALAGTDVPTIIAFSGTTLNVPTVSIQAAEYTALQTYIMRPQDNIDEIRALFAKNISPASGLIAVSIISVGGALLAVYAAGRRGHT